MTEEQRHRFYRMCIDYRTAPVGQASGPYLALLYHVETLIDEAVKDAINAQNSDKAE